MNSYLDEVLAVAADGNAIFPATVWYDDNGKKHVQPHVKQWQSGGATVDPDVITTWWTNAPNAYVCRPEVGDDLTVDIDMKDGVNGMEHLVALIKDHPDLVEAFTKTRRVRTASGGWHFQFRNPEGYAFHNDAGQIAPGIDFRVAGKGMLIAPPSPGYLVEHDGPRLEIPKGFYDLYAAKVSERRREIELREEDEVNGDEVMYNDGERTQYLITTAARLRHSGLSKEELLEVLYQRNKAHCNPPCPIEKLQGIANQYGQYAKGELPKTPEEQLHEGRAQAAQLNATAVAQRKAKNPKSPVLTCLRDVQEKDYKFFLYPYMAMGTLTTLAAKGGTGKGTFSNYLAALASTGRLGEISKTNADEPMNVVIFTREDSPSEKIRPEIALAGGNLDRIYICDKLEDGSTFSFAEPEKFNEAFTAAFADGKPGFVIIDNAGDFGDRANDGNNYKAVTQELTPLVDLAQHYNATILLMMHENRSGNYMGSAAYENKPRSRLSYKKTEEPNVCILTHEKKNLFYGDPLLFGAEQHDVPGREYPVWKVSYNGVASESQREKTKQQTANDYLRNRLQDRPVPNALLLEEFEENNWSAVYLSRARTAIGAGVVTVNGVKCTADVMYIMNCKVERAIQDEDVSEAASSDKTVSLQKQYNELAERLLMECNGVMNIDDLRHRINEFKPFSNESHNTKKQLNRRFRTGPTVRYDDVTKSITMLPK